MVMSGTHYLADGSIVFPEGYDAGDLTLLPPDYDERIHSFDGTAFVADWSRVDAKLHRQIDAGAEALRAPLISNIAGQQMTYLNKEREADAWTVSSNPLNFPYLNEEATRKGQPIATVAAMVKATAAQWRAIDARIEGARTAAKDAVTAASDMAGKEAAANVDWQGLLA